MLKRYTIISVAFLLILSIGITAFSLTDAEILAIKGSMPSYDFMITNNGNSYFEADPAYKNDSYPAYISPERNTTYWPSTGVTMRVRNEQKQYATVAKVIQNGKTELLDYLSGQNYKGWKYLYGSISDSAGYEYQLRVQGKWLP